MNFHKERKSWDSEEVTPLRLYDVEQPLFSFVHRHRNINAAIQINRRVISQFIDGQGWVFMIGTTYGVPLGFIDGFSFIQKGKVIFEANQSVNLQRPRYSQNPKVPIPRAIAASISQIIKHGIIDVWISSYALTTEGAGMYEEFLVKDPNLKISAYEFEDGNGFILTRK